MPCIAAGESMKRQVLFILVALLLPLSGGWAPPSEARAEEAVPQSGALEAPKFVKIDPIVLPVIQQNKVTRFITIVVTLEMDVDDAILRVQSVKRQLVDALFTELHGLFSLEMVQKRGPEAPLVKQRVQVVCERILGPGMVKSVLIQGVSQRRPT